MKHSALILLLAASTLAASAQTPAKPTTPAAAKPATTTAKPAATAAKSVASIDKLPPGIPPVKTLKKTLFTVSLRYQDIKVGTGAVAESGKLYKVLYTGWLASDGHKFDSTDDHPRPSVMDKDGKPVLGNDGKPQQGPPQPISFPQGMGRVIPGWDQAFEGMKVNGKRRIFIPWRLAYGEKGRPGPDAAHPGIPAKADLIFDIELVDVTDMPTQPMRPGMGGAPRGVHPNTPGAPAQPGTSGAAAPNAAPNAAPAPAAPSTAPVPTAPAAPSAAPAPAAPTPAPAAPAAPAAPQTK
jgi:peptidylprolyl isomerase